MARFLKNLSDRRLFERLAVLDTTANRKPVPRTVRFSSPGSSEEKSKTSSSDVRSRTLADVRSITAMRVHVDHVRLGGRR